jgi:hypothetical protein
MDVEQKTYIDIRWHIFGKVSSENTISSSILQSIPVAIKKHVTLYNSEG